MIKRLLILLGLAASPVCAAGSITLFVPAPINQSSGTINAFTAQTVNANSANFSQGIQLNGTSSNYLAFQNGTQAIILNAPLSLPAGYILTLPSAQGGSSTFLENNGTGNLFWGIPLGFDIYPASSTASFPQGFSASTATIGAVVFNPGATGLVTMGGGLNVAGPLNLALAGNECLQTNGAGNIITSGAGCGSSSGGSGGNIAFLFNGSVISSPTVAVVVDTATLNYVNTAGSVSSGTLSVNQNLNISTLTLSGTGAAALNMTEGAASTIMGVATNHDLFWADSSSHTFEYNPNNTSTFTISGTSTTNTSGDIAVWSGTGLSLVDGGLPGGGGTPATPFHSLQYNNLGVFGGATGLLYNGSVFTDQIATNFQNIANSSFTNVSTISIQGVYFDNHQSSVTAGWQNGILSDTGGSYLYTGPSSTNLFLGLFAGNVALSTTALQTTVVGFESMLSPTGGSNNTVLGFDSLNGNSNYNNDVAVGQLNLNTGNVSQTVAVGYAALNTVVGINDTGIGNNTGFSLINGSSNTLVGAAAGYGTDLSSAATNLQGDTFIGYEAGISTVNASGSAITKSVAIGYGAVVASSNTAIIATQNLSIQGSSVPVVSSCGSSPSNVGSDTAGTITIGSGITTACTLTFSTPWLTTPTCIESDNSTTVTGDISSISTTAVTFGFSASLGSGQVYYICIGSK